MACHNKEDVKLSNDVRWVSQSSEYSSLCEQIYNSAKLVLQDQFEGIDRPVIVMDLDETVLNNVQYQVELFETSEKYNPTSWNAWVNKELATAVPGAKSFILDFKDKYKGLIVFISNRDASTIKATRNNLDNLGLLFEDDIFLLRKDKKDTNSILLSDIKENSSSSLEYVQLDAMNYSELEKTVKDFKISEIYHLAAILSAKGEENPMLTWDLNMNSLFNVLELAKNKLVEKIFWPSSISVFGNNTPKVETDQFSIKEPTTVYGISKLAGERWCEYYNSKYDTDIRSIRFPGIISSNTLPGGGTTDYAVEIFYSFLKKEKYSCFLNKKSMLPMIYINDAIESIYKIMSVNKENLTIKSSYNLAGFSLSPEIIEKKLNNIDSSFRVDYNPDFRQNIANSWPDSINDNYSRMDWSWEPKYDLNKTIQEMINNLEVKLK